MRFAPLTALLALSIACDPPGNNVPEFSFNGRPSTGCANIDDENCADGDPWFQNATRDTISKLYAWPSSPTTTPGAGSEGVCDESLEAFNPGDAVTWPALTFNVQVSDVDRDDLTLEVWLRAANGDDRDDTPVMLCETTVYGRGQDRTVPFGELATNDCALYLALNASRGVRDEIEDALGADLRVNSDPRDSDAIDPASVEAANAVEVFVAVQGENAILEFADIPMPCSPGAEDDYCITAHDDFANISTSPQRVYEVELRVADDSWDSLSEPAVQAQLNKHALFQVYTFDPRFSWGHTIAQSDPAVPQERPVDVVFSGQEIEPALSDQYFNYVACRESGGVGASSVAAASVNPRELDGAPAAPTLTAFNAADTKRGDTIVLKSATCWAPELTKANGEPEPTVNYCTPVSVVTAEVGAFEAAPSLTHSSADPWSADPRAVANPTVSAASGLGGAVLWHQWLVSGELVGAPASQAADDATDLTAAVDYEVVLPSEAGPLDELGLVYGYCPPGVQPAELSLATGWLKSAGATTEDATLGQLCTALDEVTLEGMIPLTWSGELTEEAPFTTPNASPIDFTDLVAHGTGSWILSGPEGAEWFNANLFPYTLFFTEPRGIAGIVGSNSAAIVHGDIAYVLDETYNHSTPLDTSACDLDPSCGWADFQGSGEVVGLLLDGAAWVVGSDQDSAGELVASAPVAIGGSPVPVGISLGEAYALHATEDGLVFAVTVRDVGSGPHLQVRAAEKLGVIWTSGLLYDAGVSGSITSSDLSLDYDPIGGRLLVGVGSGDGEVFVFDLASDPLDAPTNAFSITGVRAEAFGRGVAFKAAGGSPPTHFYALAPNMPTDDASLRSPVSPTSVGVLYELALPAGAQDVTSSADAEGFFTFPANEDVSFITHRGDARGEVYLAVAPLSPYSVGDLYPLP